MQITKSNYGTTLNTICVTHTKWNGDFLSIFFSYDTVVAFQSPSTGTIVMENQWGPTTGKHLNLIDNGDKKNRVKCSNFGEMLQNAYSLFFKDINPEPEKE